MWQKGNECILYFCMFLSVLYLFAKFNLTLDSCNGTVCVARQWPEDGLICPKLVA
jgi:hypothetical protein